MSVLVEKMKMFKELNILADKIKERKKYTKIGKQIYLTEKCYKIAEGDSKFISAVLFNSNPVYHIIFKCNESNEICGFTIEHDFDSSLTSIIEKINEEYDWKVAQKRKDQFTILEDITDILNKEILEVYKKNGMFNTQTEIEKYFRLFDEQLENCIKALEKMDYNSKNTMIRICNKNLQFTRDIKNNISTFDPSTFKMHNGGDYNVL